MYVMEKNIELTINLSWSEIKNKLDEFIKRIEEPDPERPEFVKDHVKVLDGGTIEIVDFDIPLSEISETFKDRHIEKEVIKIDNYDPIEITVMSDHLGSLSIRKIYEDYDKTEVKVKINFKPRGLGFAVGAALTGVYLAMPEKEIQETVQGWIDEGI